MDGEQVTSARKAFPYVARRGEIGTYRAWKDPKTGQLLWLWVPDVPDDEDGV